MVLFWNFCYKRTVKSKFNLNTRFNSYNIFSFDFACTWVTSSLVYSPIVELIRAHVVYRWGDGFYTFHLKWYIVTPLVLGFMAHRVIRGGPTALNSKCLPASGQIRGGVTRARYLEDKWADTIWLLKDPWMMCLGLAMGTRNPMGFYSIRARVWINF